MGRGADLVAALEPVDSLVIVAHDNPDPDCLASALALKAIAAEVPVDEITIAYGGRITHQQNLAFVDRLAVPVEPLDTVAVAAYDAVAFVDHSTPGANVSLPESITPDIAIDHHRGGKIEGTIVDVRPHYGATATILVEYLLELEVEITPRLATALLFALHRERLDFVRHPTRREYEAALTVYDSADLTLLAELYGSAFEPETVDAIGRAITSRQHRDGIIVASAGRTPLADAMPQAADYLLNVEGVATTLVFGLVDGTVRLSARTNDPGLHVGKALQRAFGRYGSFGGHHDMGGGTIDLGLFGTIIADEDAVLETLEERIPERFFGVLGEPSEDRQRQEA